MRIWYDGFGQPATVLSHMSGQARYINHNYDKDGNREHLTFTNDGARFRFHYDGLGRMSAVHDRAEHSSADDLVVRYWHRAEGPRHVALFGSGPAGLTPLSGAVGPTSTVMAVFAPGIAARARFVARNCAFIPPAAATLRAAAEIGSRRRDGRISAREDLRICAISVSP